MESSYRITDCWPYVNRVTDDKTIHPLYKFHYSYPISFGRLSYGVRLADNQWIKKPHHAQDQTRLKTQNFSRQSIIRICPRHIKVMRHKTVPRSTGFRSRPMNRITSSRLASDSYPMFNTISLKFNIKIITNNCSSVP